MHAILEPFLLIRFQHKSSLHNICRVRKYSTTVDKGHAIFLRWIDPSLPLRCPNCAAGAPLPADPPAVSGPVSGLIMLLNIKRIKSCKGVHVWRSNSTNNCKDSWNQPPSKKLVDGRLGLWKLTQKRLDIYIEMLDTMIPAPVIHLQSPKTPPRLASYDWDGPVLPQPSSKQLLVCSFPHCS